MTVSSAVEMAALEPKAPWLMAEGQDQGYEKEWQSSNTRNIPVLHYKQKDLSGQPVPNPPGRVQVSAERLGPSMALVQQMDNDLQASTSVYDPGLGKMTHRDRSGRAIQSLQQQGEQANSHFLYNLADISMPYEAKVILDLMPKIYDKPGRLIQVMDEEDTSEVVMINQPYVKDPRTGKHVPIQKDPKTGQDIPPPPSVPGGPPAEIQHFDLRKGTYTVAISVGKSFPTMRQEASEALGEILQSRPEMMAVIGPRYFRLRDEPGMRELADDLMKIRDRQFPFLSQPEDGAAPTPEQAMAQMDQMKQENEQLKGAVKQLQDQLHTDAVKQGAQIQKAQIDQKTTLTKAQMDNETKLALENMKQRLAMLEANMDRGHDSKLTELQNQHEVAMAAADAGHEAQQATQAQATASAQLLPPFTQPDNVPLGPEEALGP
jgi:hypothetical protein